MRAFPFSSIISVVLSSALVMAPLWAQTPAPGPAATGAEPDTLQIHILDSNRLAATVRAGEQQSLSVEVTDSTGKAVSNAAVTCRLPDNGATGTFSDGTHAAVAYTDGQGKATIDRIRWGAAPGSIAIRITATKGTIHTGILAGTSVAATGTVGEPVSTHLDQTVVAVPYTSQTQPAAAQPAISEPAVSVTTPAGKLSPQPGQLAAQAGALDPKPNQLTPEAADPNVSVTRTSAADAPHSSHAKWLILLAVVAAAGAGAAFAMKGKASSSTSNNSALSIGNPTVSVGQP